MFDANRRKYPRAKYPCQLTLWVQEGRSETILADTYNIGIGGLGLRIKQGFDIGTKVDIQIHFKGLTTPFRCRGVVVRALKSPDGLYNIGIQFEPLGELKSAFLDGKVAELMEMEKKGKS